MPLASDEVLCQGSDTYHLPSNFVDNWQAYYAVKGWQQSLKSQKNKVDVCFFGNSLTYGISFLDSIPNKRMCVIGYCGADIDMMFYTAPLLEEVEPRKIFIMAGINGLEQLDDNSFEKKYNQLLDSVVNYAPHAQLYLESLLPHNKAKKPQGVTNRRIVEANEIIKSIAEKRQLTYVDIHSHYCEDGQLPDSLTEDGMHLIPIAYGRWFQAVKPYMNE